MKSTNWGGRGEEVEGRQAEGLTLVKRSDEHYVVAANFEM